MKYLPAAGRCLRLRRTAALSDGAMVGFNRFPTISLEERMACGVGACLGCVCRSKDTDSHSHVKNKRVCKDGPVFAAGEVEL